MDDFDQEFLFKPEIVEPPDNPTGCTGLDEEPTFLAITKDVEVENNRELWKMKLDDHRLLKGLVFRVVHLVAKLESNLNPEPESTKKRIQKQLSKISTEASLDFSFEVSTFTPQCRFEDIK